MRRGHWEHSKQCLQKICVTEEVKEKEKEKKQEEK